VHGLGCISQLRGRGSTWRVDARRRVLGAVLRGSFGVGEGGSAWGTGVQGGALGRVGERGARGRRERKGRETDSRGDWECQGRARGRLG
jgi:hypothetical protein